MTGYIYKITNIKNKKVYIGQTIQSPHARFAAHVYELNSQTKKNSKFQSAWNKYGADCFKFEVIAECSEEELDDYERYYIGVYDSFNNGYNATIGGKQCMERRRHTPETRHKMSEDLKRRWHDTEYRRKISTAHSMNRAVICVNTGTIYRTSMDAAQCIGVNNSNVIRACNKKTVRCGTDNNGSPLLWAWLDEYDGYTVKDEYVGNKGGNNRRSVRNIETNAIYRSATEAAKALGVSKSTISKACAEKLKTAAGYHWEFV